MKTNKLIMIFAFIVAVIVIYMLFMKDGVETKNNLGVSDNKSLDTSREESSAEKTDSTFSTKAGTYEAYSPDKIARAEDGHVVLFFHASWCPTCRGLDTDIEKNIGAIPTGVSILKADYDSETELKRKYGVTYQHTLVQVDKDGNMIKKWSGGATLASILSKIN